MEKNYFEARREKLHKCGDKGFTLMEMLIVVAVIAVLITIAIPVFTGQLENSREATDAANIRSAYAEIAAAALTTPDEDTDATVDKKQTQEDWQNTSIEDITGVAIAGINSVDRLRLCTRLKLVQLRLMETKLQLRLLINNIRVTATDGIPRRRPEDILWPSCEDGYITTANCTNGSW